MKRCIADKQLYRKAPGKAFPGAAGQALCACANALASALRRLRLPLLTLLFFFCLFGHAAAEEAWEFTALRDFRGLVRRDMAESMARLAAELAATDQAVRILAKNEDLRFAASPARQGEVLPAAGSQEGFLAPGLPVDGLARMLFTTRIISLGVEGFPPAVQATARLRLVPPKDTREALLHGLRRPELMEIHSQILARQRFLLARYDDLAAKLLPMRPSVEGGMEESHALKSIFNEIAALEIFIALLDQYDQHWRDPEKAHGELARAERLAPGNPLILTAMSEALLQLDRPVPALERVGEALKTASNYSRAHDVKGAILLRQRLPALAAESFSKAISLSPGNGSYFLHRASAYLVLENEPGMCGDFTTACGLGDCEGLKWAKEAGKCRPQAR